MDKKRIIIDCDPGQDDAVALCFAFGSPEIEVLGISVVAGNVPLHHCVTNALKICELCDREDVPVYAGCPRPILKELITAEHVHGKDGLEGANLPDPNKRAEDKHAVDFLVDTLMASDGDITLCVTGPMTNVALAIIKEPRIVPKIKELVLMGGAMALGNITPAAEFNFFIDPHAAATVFKSGVKLTMLGLDVTMHADASHDRIQEMKDVGTKAAETMASILSHHTRHDSKRFGVEPLHDPCVIGYLLKPELYKGKDCFVKISVRSKASEGKSVVDWYGVTGEAPNAMVMNELDPDGFFALLNERLANLG